MTLVVGMLCSDAILLFADREENSGIVGKRSVNKMHRTLGQKWAMAIATSGRSSISDLAARKIIDRADKLGDSFPEQHEQVITDTLKPIILGHVYAKALPRDVQRERSISSNNRVE